MAVKRKRDIDNSMFKMPADSELDAVTLQAFINDHEKNKTLYDRFEALYEDEPPIMDKPRKERNKPDNRLSVNFARHLIDTYNGYFIGVPPSVQHSDEDINTIIQTFWRRNDMADVLSELSKITSLYGHGYLYLFQDEDGLSTVAYNDPYDMFVIYTDTIKPQSLYGIRYAKSDEGGYKGEVYTADEWYTFELDGDQFVTHPGGELYYGRVPIIEFSENEGRNSLIEPVESMINAYNEGVSEKANDIEYFSDAFLKVIGVDLMEPQQDENGNEFRPVDNVKNSKIINLTNDGSGNGAEDIEVEFMSKPNADQSQENFLDRIERLIYKTTGVANINDEKNGGNPTSAEALKVRLHPMNNKASVKERKFEKGLRTLFSMFFSIQTNVPSSKSDEYLGISYKWHRNSPTNITEEVENVEKLDGIVSRKKQIEQLSFVDDADEELERIKQEDNEGAED